MTYEEILHDLNGMANRKTKDIDRYNKGLIRAGADVSCLKEYVLSNPLVHRTYFQVSLGEIKDMEAQFQFIEDNGKLLQDWWHVDQLTQFLIKPLDFDFAISKAKIYINSDRLVVRRWGYVLFLAGLQKSSSHTADILSLMKDDDEYYVQMAEAWLIADLAVYSTDEVVRFIETASLKYSITGKAVQKICDSYRISPEVKAHLRSIRPRLKKPPKERLALEVIERLKREYPDSDCTLDYDEAWKLLVSVRLAAQCTDARVNIVVKELFEKYPNIDALADAPVDEIEKIIHPCGLGNSKAKDISGCMKMLRDEYGGKVPDDFAMLLKLPGVGRKSANLVIGDVFGKPAIVTDTHCIRLSNRIGLVDNEKAPEKVERELRKIVPPEEGNGLCHRLVDHGRAVCTARTKPYCDKCCLNDICKKQGI